MSRLKNLKKWLKENWGIIVAYIPVIGMITMIVLVLTGVVKFHIQF